MAKTAVRARETASILSTRRPTAVTGTITRYLSLVQTIPPLLKKQRRLAARIATMAEAVKAEREVRAEMDGHLVTAGLGKGEVVTCDGYDIRHNEKAGSSSINETKLAEMFVAAGVTRELVDDVIKESTEIGKPSVYATVIPSKGAKVQRPEQLHMVKARR